MEGYEEDFIDILNFSRTLPAESLVGACRAELTDQRTTMSDYEEVFIDIQNFSKSLSIESSVGAYRTESTDQWPTSSGNTVNIPPRFNGSTSWFKYEELFDDWLDLTQLEAGKRRPALENRLVGDAAMYKGLLDRESLRAEDGVKYFKDT